MEIVIVSLASIFLGCIESDSGITRPVETEPVLSDYPELFKEEVIIVIGSNASGIEKESAEAIAANLENLTGNKPEIISSKEIEGFKYTYNLVIIGTPKSNEVLREVYGMTDATRVTEEFPGEGEGVLEILKNPWDEEKAMLLVEGSDEWGVKAGGEMLEQVRDVDKFGVVVEWNGINAVFPRSIPQDKYILLSLHQEISGSRLMIDFPPLIRFDKDSGILECESCDFEINNELSIVILNTIELRKPGGGGGGGLIPIYTLPDSRNLPFLLKITYIESDGTVYLSYANTDITLKPKEYYIGEFREEWAGDKVTCNIRIENYGLCSKDRIKLGGTE